MGKLNKRVYETLIPNPRCCLNCAFIDACDSDAEAAGMELDHSDYCAQYANDGSLILPEDEDNASPEAVRGE